MSHLLRRPASVPSLFSPGVETDPARTRARNRVETLPWTRGSAALIHPALMLVAELPLLRCAADLLRLALPH